MNLPLPSFALKLPLSKSIVNRILVLEFVCGHNPGVLYSRLDPECLCKDIIELADALTALWNQLQAPDCRRVVEVNITEGAAPLRFFIAAAASTPGAVVNVRVAGRLAERPIVSLLDTLRSMGGEIAQKPHPGGYELRIIGKRLKATDFKVDITQTSQFLSALILVSPNIEEWEEVKLPQGAVSSSYVFMTETLVKNRNCDLFQFVEADWSAAANFFVCSLLFGCHIELMGLKEDSLQGDSFIATLYKSLGGQLTFTDESVIIQPQTVYCDSSIVRTGTLSLPLGETPDLVPPLAVGLALGGIKYRLMGIDHLRHKESDRIDVLIREMRKIGFVLRYSCGSLVWDGEHCIRLGIPLDPHGDHRMAMAFAFAERKGLGAVINKEVVDKSYPLYWRHLSSLFPSVNS